MSRDSVHISVPATSANLGSGYDCYGIALEYRDHVRVRAVTGRTSVRVIGQGAGEVPEDETHLIVRMIRMALDHVGAPQVGLAVECTNKIPHGRGMGSSAAAIVAGIYAAAALLDEPEALNLDTVFALAAEVEGHPDNVAPAVYGGAQLSWSEAGVFKRVAVPVGPLPVTVFIPDVRLETKRARALLPLDVTHADATFQVARAALLAPALAAGTDRPDLLLAATADRLHQDYRRSAMGASADLMYWLRERDIAAYISGAGPTVAALGKVPTEVIIAAKTHGWIVHRLEVCERGVCAIAP